MSMGTLPLSRERPSVCEAESEAVRGPTAHLRAVRLSAVVLPWLLASACQGVPVSDLNPTHLRACSLPSNLDTALDGFDPLVRELWGQKNEDLDADGRMDLVYLTGSKGGLASSAGSALDVLVCGPMGQWEHSFHQELQPVGPVTLEVCDCRWDDPNQPSPPEAGSKPAPASIILTSESLGASGWSSSLDIYQMDGGQLRPRLSRMLSNTRGAVANRRLILTYYPSLFNEAEGKHLRSYTFEYHREDGSFREVDLPLEPGAPASSLMTSPEPKATDPNLIPSPDPKTTDPILMVSPQPRATDPGHLAAAFTDLRFCSDADMDMDLERCFRSPTHFPSTTRRIYLTWYAAHTHPYMFLTQTWQRNGEPIAGLSSPPNPPKRWTAPWEDESQNYTYVDSCSRDALAPCQDTITPGRYDVTLFMDNVPMVSGSFEVRP